MSIILLKRGGHTIFQHFSKVSILNQVMLKLRDHKKAGGWPCYCKDPTITRSSSVIKHLATAAVRVPVLTGRNFWEESAVTGWGS